MAVGRFQDPGGIIGREWLASVPAQGSLNVKGVSGSRSNVEERRTEARARARPTSNRVVSSFSLPGYASSRIGKRLRIVIDVMRVFDWRRRASPRSTRTVEGRMDRARLYL